MKLPFSSPVDGIFFKHAFELALGDEIQEPDGFLWRVVDLPNRTAKTVTLTLEPVFASMTARGRTDKKFKRLDRVRCAKVNDAAKENERVVAEVIAKDVTFPAELLDFAHATYSEMAEVVRAIRAELKERNPLFVNVVAGGLDEAARILDLYNERKKADAGYDEADERA